MCLHFCSNAGSTSQPQLPVTRYLSHTLYLTPQEMHHGSVRNLSVQYNLVCDECRGSGAKNGIVVHYDTCERCTGSGETIVIDRTVPGIEERLQQECGFCRGVGDAIIPAHRCRNCRGRKTLPNSTILIVNIRPGTRHGQKIIYRGEGNQEPNKRRGDVIVYLEVNDDGFFE